MDVPQPLPVLYPGQGFRVSALGKLASDNGKARLRLGELLNAGVLMEAEFQRQEGRSTPAALARIGLRSERGVPTCHVGWHAAGAILVRRRPELRHSGSPRR
jgi:hypothetical protein